MKGVAHMGFEEMTPIQAQAIPVVLGGADVVGQAQTGTGKTAAFGIPILEKINPRRKKTQAVIICPTRELAMQVAEEISNLARFMPGVKILPVYGGQDIARQIRALKAGVQIVVGTPGRIMDHMRRETVSFADVRTVVLDEADEMLDMGFREDIETILTDIREDRQTLLFSATMPKPILELAGTFLKDPTHIKIVKKELTVPSITQHYYEVRRENKTEVLSRLLDVYDPKRSMIFCNTKKGVDELVEELQGRGYFVEGLHGDMKQSLRDRVMRSFRTGKTEILIATDVAARGIDVDDVDVVFNYDLPQDDEYYVHRIGRTGRAGKDGLAITLICGREIYKLRDIKRYCKANILAQRVPSINAVAETRIEKTFTDLAEYIRTEELDHFRDMVERFVSEHDCTTEDMAAALLSQTMGEFDEDAEDIREVNWRITELDDERGRTPSGRKERERNTRDGRSGRDRRDDRDGRDRRKGGKMERLFINIGKRSGIRPGDILGAIVGESGIPGKMVGSIDMFEKYTFVDVPKDVSGIVIKAMKNAKIKGKAINVERAKDIE